MKRVSELRSCRKQKWDLLKKTGAYVTIKMGIFIILQNEIRSCRKITDTS